MNIISLILCMKYINNYNWFLKQNNLKKYFYIAAGQARLFVDKIIIV